MPKQKIEVKGLSKTFYMDGRRLPTLEEVNLTVYEREFVSILGPSGCGKSTFFNILAGITKRDSGVIIYEGKRVEDLRGMVAYMQQKDLLLPWRNILSNAILGPEIEGKDRKWALEKARKLLYQFGLGGFERRYPQELSGGMRQRAALVRTLLLEKDVLLLDEPFGALDAMTRSVMQKILSRVSSKYRKTVFLVTHDVEEALLLSDRIYLFTHRPARVKEVFEIPLSRPRNTTDPHLVALKGKILRSIFEEIGTLNEVWK